MTRMMMRPLTRSGLIQMWFASVLILVASALGFGMSVTAGTAVLLLGMCLVPPAIVMALWPGVQPQTASDVLRGTDRTR
jgi:hypothetical protein